MKEIQHHSLDLHTINLNFITLLLLLQRFSKHQLSHPIDTVILAFDGEMVSFAFDSLLRNQLKCKSCCVFDPLSATLLRALQSESFQSRSEFSLLGDATASDGIPVHINGLLRSRVEFSVAMHGELCAFETTVSVGPFVGQELGLAFSHPAGVCAFGAVAEVSGYG